MKCCLCNNPIDVEHHTGWAGGHNAQPIKDGRCCSDCNDVVVIPFRFADIGESLGGKYGN